MHYRVTSFAYDAGSGTAFYVDDNLALTRPRRGRRQDRRQSGCCSRAHGSARSSSIRSTVRCSACATLMVSRRSCGFPYPYNTWTASTRFRGSTYRTDLDISPDGRLLSATMSEDNGDQYLRVWELDKLLSGDLSHCPSSVRAVRARGLRVLPRRPLPVRQQLLHRRVEHLSLRSRHRRGRSGFECRDRFLPPRAARRRALVVLTYTGAGFVPAIIDPRPIEDVSAITFLGAAARGEVSRDQDVAGAGSEHGRRPKSSSPQREPVRAAAPRRTRQCLSRCCRATRTPSASATTSTSTIRCSSRASAITAAYTPDEKLRSDERGHVDITGRYGFWHGELSWNRSDFYDLFGPTERSRKGYAAKLGYDWLLIYDTPRRLDLLFRRGVLRPDRHAAQRAERRNQLHATGDGRGRAALHRCAALARRGRRREGRDLGVGLSRESRARREPRRSFAASSILGLPLRCRIRRSGCAAPRALPTATATASSRISTSAAFGNNYVDDGSIKRYRDYDSLPGFEIDEVSALNYVREMVEWNLPPVRLRVGGHAELLSDVAAAVAVRRGSVGGPRQRSTPRGVPTPAGRST